MFLISAKAKKNMAAKQLNFSPPVHMPDIFDKKDIDEKRSV
jgi:hypothetical protein